jgi:membrane protease subunit (stomatin/prohibitin family)
MSFSKKIIGGATGALLLATTMSISVPAQADNSGAFIGGVMAARVGHNMRARTQAEQQQAQYAQQSAQQQPVQQAAPAPAARSSQQKLDELNKLAAGGYITPDEYKKKKQSIIDSM